MIEGYRTSADCLRVPEPALQEQEETLVSRCMEGDAWAWETMIRTYGRQIGSMVCRYAHLKEEAEDLTQEVFLRVYLNLGTFRANSGKLTHWLRRVGRNLIIDHLRRNHRFVTLQGAEQLDGLCLKHHATPETTIARNEASSLLHHGLSLLAPELQQVLVLRYLEEMSYQEISRMLGVPKGTVKSRISRGRARLADHFLRQRLC